ncbi:MAG TPA: YdcF family protein [Planctomycetaceae bacterium]|nr:YdcF family protein [Planctomycetaceae bacterium]
MERFLAILPPYKSVLQPFPLLVLGLGFTLALAWRRFSDQRKSLRWPTVFYVLLLLDCLPFVGWLTAGTLERWFPRIEHRPDNIAAIVVLGGGILPPAEDGEPTRPHVHSLQRALRAAELYHEGPRCPLIVSGGKTSASEPGDCVAVAMAHVLRQAGVHEDDLVIEDVSRNTIENAAESAKWLKAHRIDKHVLLVTTATHLPRSVPMFRQHGIDVIPAGCEFHLDEMPATIEMLLPKTSAVVANHQAWYEFWGMLRYRAFGR